ncbi:hypothetical protein JCM8202_003741 [Rhodotorula sphaerocarpa]
MPVDSVRVTFLGTAAGRPSSTRNVSSLAIQLDAQIWLVDAGEGTQHRLMDSRCPLAMSKITRILITHLHADHINGLPGLLATISAGDGIPQPSTSNGPQPAEPAPIEIYGPLGLRQFLRVTLSLTQTILSRPYTVHELLFPDESPSDEPDAKLHPSEKRGRDLQPDEDGYWREIVTNAAGGGFSVSAGPIQHTIRCLGYLFHEFPRPLPIQPRRYLPHLKDPQNAAGLLADYGLRNPISILSRLQTDRAEITLRDGTVLVPPELDRRGGRRLVVLGDTYDAMGMVPLVRDDPAPELDLAEDALEVDLVVHEATNAFLPDLDDSQAPTKHRAGAKAAASSPAHGAPTLASVTELARSHGHSTPQVAGTFARAVRARRLVLNHLSVKYPDPDALEAMPRGDGAASEASREKWRAMLLEIVRQAEEAMGSGAGTGALNEADAAGGGPAGTLGRVVAARDFMQIDLPRRDKQAKP